MIKLKKAFTLAEVLVTMAILGVLIGLTTRALNDVRPNQEMIMYKKAYYTTSRIVSELVNDDDLYPENMDDLVHDGLANTTIEAQTGNGEAIYKGQRYSGPGKFCRLFAAKLNINLNACNARTNINNGGNFTTPDGMVWSMPASAGAFTGADNREYIVVDINGSRGDNCTLDNVENLGTTRCNNRQIPDQFIISVGKYGEVAATSELSRRYLSSNKTTRSFKKFNSCIYGSAKCGE